jgi:hypothetical protein
LPPVSDVDAELEVAGDLAEQTFVIAFDFLRSADRGQIDVGCAHIPFVQPVDGAHDEAGLAGLAGSQHVGVLPIDQELKKLAVFRPWNVDVLAWVKGPAGLNPELNAHAPAFLKNRA